MVPSLAVPDALATAVVVALLFVLPGIAWGPVLAPGAGSPLIAAGRAAAVSLLTTATGCTILARLGLLTPPAVLLLLAGLTAAPYALPSRRAAARRALRAAQFGRRRRLGWALGATAGIGVAVLLVIGPSRAAVGDALLPYSSTVWYYAHLAQATAASGGFPASLAEWGTQRPFQVDYLPVTAHTAAVFALLPGLDIRFLLEVYRLSVLVSFLLVAAMLFRRFVSSWIAAMGALLLAGTVRLDSRLLAYRPEAWALVPMLFTLWLTDRAIVERSRRLALLASASAAVTYLAHAEVFLLLGPGVAGLAVARLVAAGGRLGLRGPDRRSVTVAVAAGALVLGGGMVLGSGAALALTGEARVLGYAAGRPAAAPAQIPPGEVPAGWTFTRDPTWDFYVAAVAPGQLGAQPPRSFVDRRLLPRSTAHVWPGLDGRVPAFLLVLGALVAAPFVAWPFLDRRRRAILVAVAVFGAGLLVGAYLLFAISHTYVPQRTGPRRLVPYELLVPVVAAVVVLWGVNRVLVPGWRALIPRRRTAMAVSGAFLAVVTAGMLAPSPLVLSDDQGDPGLTVAGYDAYRWVGAHVPAGSRILANAYTDGSLAALTGDVGILDGRAVYLEDPAFLADATRLVLGARSLFLDPGGAGAGAYLARNRVDYLLVAGEGAISADLGGYAVFQTDRSALAASGRYTLVESFEGGKLLLYAVNVPSAAGGGST